MSGTDLTAIFKFHANHFFIFEQDALHGRFQAQLAPSPLQSAHKSAGNGESPAARIVTAVEIMVRHPGLHKRGYLRGRQAVIAGLSGQDRFQKGLGYIMIDQILPGTPRPAQHRSRIWRRLDCADDESCPVSEAPT